MNLSLILFLIGVLGFVLNRKNIILMLISIEIMLLAITFFIFIIKYLLNKVMYLTTIILPLLGSVISGFLGRKMLSDSYSLTFIEQVPMAFYRLRGSIVIQLN